MRPEPDRTLEFDAVQPVTHAARDGEPDAPDESRPGRLALYAGIALEVVGWLVLYLGYNGAATHPREPAQLPYVISGGLGGAAIILLGGLLIVASILLGMQSRLASELRALRQSIDDLGDALSAGPQTAHASRNGSVVVLRGGSTFHRPDCRLVAHKPGARFVASALAAQRGLSPCRVCKPD